MKFAWVWLMACSTLLHAGELTFSETFKEIHAGADAKTISVDFDFKNTTKAPITIQKTETACSCMTIQISDKKMTYAPGESGKVKATFDMGNFSGDVDKELFLWVDGDAEDKPSGQLKVRVHIPVLVSIEPRTLRWKAGEKPESKTLKIEMHDDKPIKILSVTPSTDAFVHELKTLEEGKSYELKVTPKSTAEPGLAIFRIKTDSKNDRNQIVQAFAIIPKAIPGAAAEP